MIGTADATSALRSAFGRTRASADGANLWTRYLSVWTGWNHVCTAGSFAAAASFIMAALRMP